MKKRPSPQILPFRRIHLVENRLESEVLMTVREQKTVRTSFPRL